MTHVFLCLGPGGPTFEPVWVQNYLTLLHIPTCSGLCIEKKEVCGVGKRAGAAHPCNAGYPIAFNSMTDRMQRFERAANMLVAGRKVSIAVRELPQGNVQAWLAELKSYVIFGHTDPGDEVTYKVYATVKEGRAIAQAKLAYIN